ncbi:MAG: CoA activase, partial [Planctomycetes bacterium]|nr:CoA activase [Planctomycetota bacterium]
SKYVSLENGAVVDFTMNKVCAAGTGSFLEEQAEKLGISIKGEFGCRALASKTPCHLGERCTVFMESDLNHHQQRGEPIDDLVAGLSYSIVLNYLNRVVEDRKVGDTIFFQGGTAYNRGVTAAFEKITGKKIIVPPHHDVIGAIGAAIIAMEQSAGESKFRGFDLSKRKYTIDTFECKDCSNNCEVRRVSVEGMKPLHYGSRCGKFDEEKRESKGKHLPRLFRERETLLKNIYGKEPPRDANAPTVGIPQITTYFELFPFWKAFFTELGLRVVTSNATNREIIHNGVESVVSEPCFPIKVAHGHVINLLEKKVDYLFLPSIINMERAVPEMQRSYTCPYVQSVPYLVRAAMDLDVPGTTILQPVMHMERGPRHVKKLLRRLAYDLGASAATAQNAIGRAYEAQQKFYDAIQKRGREILADLPEDAPSIVIVSRPYNGCDSALNLNIPEKLRDLGVLAIPLDFLPMDDPTLGKDFPDMYWRYGQTIMAAARRIASDKRLHALYITNFGCGPDSFIMKFFAKEMRGKPYLTIEVDEHSADVGAITRCEAFLDSLEHVRDVQTKPFKLRKVAVQRDLERTVYIPYMDDHGIVLAASMRQAGLKAEALPMADAASLELGRKHTTGKECYPCIITTGDILKKATSEGFEPARSAFFMPSALGPCRFGQYNKFHRMVLDDCGLGDVEIFVLDQTKDYGKHLASLGSGFRRRTWQAMVVVDLMQKLVRQVRPYEVTAGETDGVYQLYLNELATCVERREETLDVALGARNALTAIETDRSTIKPRIGMIGEIFVRSNAFSNNFVTRRIEKLGGEACLPPFEEWLDYIDWERKRDYASDGNYRRLLGEHIKAFVQERDLRRTTSVFEGAIGDFLYEEPTREILEKAEPYLHEAVRGEAVLSMGRAEEYVEKGYHGIMNLVPFNCLPGNIVNALLKKFSDNHPHIPVLKMAYDGLQQASEDTRLEAFMYQARQLADSQAGVTAI